jgi:hypothetical protein
VLLVHLLKARYQPLKHTRSWDLTVLEHRQRLQEFFEESPSLLAERDRLMEKAYRVARLRAANETGLEVSEFPESCEWSFEEVVGD